MSEKLELKVQELEDKIEELSKKYNFAIYKKWEVNRGGDVPVCEFCLSMEGEMIPYRNKYWSGYAPMGSSPSSGRYYGKLEPGKVHKGCNCTWSIVIK